MSAPHRPDADPAGADRTPVEPSTCARVARRLGELEKAHAVTPPHDQMADLRAHLGTCRPCAARLGARWRAVEGVFALRTRALPDGLLDDMRSRVLAGLHAHPAVGMSPAFLDAPVSLARWRAFATAAGVLLAVGVGLVATGRLGFRSPEGPQDQDLRDALLPPFTATRAAGEGDDLAQPFLMPGRGVRNYYRRPLGPIGPVSVEHGD
jgi:hypothetical protein